MKEMIIEFFRNRVNVLAFTITFGVLLMSLGIYIMGSKIYPFLGSRIIIFGSGIFYLSVIALVFVIE